MAVYRQNIGERVEQFCLSYDLQIPLLMAPMAGASPPLLASAVANAGGLGACGALLLTPEAIQNWAKEFRARSDGGFQMNLWVPGPAPVRDPSAKAAMRSFLAPWSADQPRTSETLTVAARHVNPQTFDSDMFYFR
jgi:nitronate monooxygenase